MFHTILVPLDVSAASEQAIPTAHQIAEGSQAALQLVHVHMPILQVYINDLSIGEIPTQDTQLDAQCRADEVAYLQRVRGLLNGNVKVQMALLPADGSVADALAHEAHAQKASLIVMTTHGRQGFSRLWLGSTADRLLRATPTPVLIVRPSTPGVVQPPIRRILLPVDGSSPPQQLMAAALTLAHLNTARITFLTVIDPTPFHQGSFWGHQDGSRSDMLRMHEATVRGYVHQLVMQCAAEGVEASSAVVISTSPAAAILDYSTEHPIDLVAMMTHARHGVKRLLLGSVADKVVRGCDLPILLVHPAEQRREAPDA